MRCEQCNRFVSLDEDTLEVDTLEVEPGRATAIARIVNTCADCGTELAEATLELQSEIPAHDTSDGHKLAISETGSERDSFGYSGGTLYSVMIDFKIDCSCGWTVTGRLQSDIDDSEIDPEIGMGDMRSATCSKCGRSFTTTRDPKESDGAWCTSCIQAAAKEKERAAEERREAKEAKEEAQHEVDREKRKQLAIKRGFQIDPDFKALIPPPDPEEQARLEVTLGRDGCQSPLIVWNAGDVRVLLDGHHRLELCEKLGKKYDVVEQACADRDAAKVWIINNQLARRNLSDFDRGRLALQLTEDFKARAKANLKTAVPGKKGGSPLATLSKGLNTRKEAAERAGLSEGTIAKIEVLDKHAPEPVKKDLSAKHITINRAHKELLGQSQQKAAASDKKKPKPATTSKKKGAAAKPALPARDPGTEQVIATVRSTLKHLADGGRSLIQQLAQLSVEGRWQKWLQGEPKGWARFCKEALGVTDAELGRWMQAAKTDQTELGQSQQEEDDE